MMRALILHLTQDVFEHMFDPAAAFREIVRTLQPGGAHVFTTPLVRKSEPTRFWAFDWLAYCSFIDCLRAILTGPVV